MSLFQKCELVGAFNGNFWQHNTIGNLDLLNPNINAT